MENSSRSQTIIISTIIFYLVVILMPMDKLFLPMVVNVISVLTEIVLNKALFTVPVILYGLLPLAAIMILMITTSDRIWRKDWLYGISVLMLYPSAWFALKENLRVYKWSIITFSVLPFFIISAVGAVYFIWKWIKYHRHE
ncbi:MAG: hypothetical protein ACLQQ4_05515 [Bacteroidia bacterium]